MGGEGSMAAANASLKNNRSLLSKRKEKGALSGSYANVKMKEFPSASPELLFEIKSRIIKENTKLKRKQIIGFLCAFIILSVFLILLLK